MAKRPLQYEDQDEVALAKERNFGEVNAENPTTRLHEYLERGENKSEMGAPVDDDWEVPSTDDDVGERVGPGEERHHGRHSPVLSVISMKSDQSMDCPGFFTFTGHKGIRIDLDKPDSLSSRFSACELSEDSTPVASSSYSPHTTEPGGVLCAVCPKSCMASFCEIHVRPHYTAQALQIHKLVEATEDLEQRLCSRHHRELELYCRTDQTAICVLCLAVEHTGHDITELGEHQKMQMNKSEMEKKTAVPPPGPIEFTSVKPDSVCVCWGPPEGLTGPQRFRVSWTIEGIKEHLEVQDLKLHVQELTPGEKYTFAVATLRDDGKQSPCVSATVQTGQNERLKKLQENARLIKDHPRNIYVLATEKNVLNETVARWTFGERDNSKKNRIIIIVGETGTGKTTLINTLVNHVLGVKFDDEMWFKISEEDENKKQTDSQTEALTVYDIFEEESPVSLTIIDTPGYGDSRGPLYDQLITENLFNLFKSEDGVQEVDAICLVLKASTV
ncbi:hypothetical protein AALO_G00044120 [Alosa alosa]|uniref:Fibronectin type-III domain-containing protein n=1 Tax=Alosa alosa TaxID=278164 RepID=A0AAV6H8X4_9TELE|nr:hypothetical protein AALO_G00044120 [Alosa alosa]